MTQHDGSATVALRKKAALNERVEFCQGRLVAA
jgi:hypothetical protein